MRTEIQKWGKSFGFWDAAVLRHRGQGQGRGDGRFSDSFGPLRIRKYSLKSLLRKVSRRNLHGKVLTGRAVGRETW